MDRLILIILFLQITDLYKMLLLPFGLQTNSFSILTLLLGIVYVISNRKIVHGVLGFNKVFKGWLWLIWVFPIIFTLIHFFLLNLSTSQLFYWIPFISLFGVLFLCSAILVVKLESDKTVNVFFLFVFISAVLGIIISYTNFSLIAKLTSTSASKLAFADAYSGSAGIDRALGFYGQQNVTAKAIVLSFLYLYTLGIAKDRKILKNLLIIVSLVCIYFTGSRTSLLMFFLQLMILIPLFTDFSKMKLLKTGRFLIIGGVFVVILINLSSYFVALGLPDLTTRLNFDSKSLNDDASIGLRVETFNIYLEHIYNNVFIGRGPTYRQEMIDNKVFPVASQNEYLETAMAFGTGAVLYYFFLILFTFSKFVLKKNIYARLTCLLMTVFLIYGFSVNYLFLDRFNVILLGVLLGLTIKTLETNSTTKSFIS
jgi:hypothetical protein